MLSLNKGPSLLNIIKWGIYLFIVVFIFFWIDWADFLVQIKNADFRYLIAASLLGMFIPIIESERIRILFDISKSSRLDDYHVNTKAMLLGHTTFGAPASDAYRIVHYKEIIGQWQLVTVGLVLLRVIGLACVLFILIGLSSLYFYNNQYVFAEVFFTNNFLKSLLLIFIVSTFIILLVYYLLPFAKKKSYLKDVSLFCDKKRILILIILSFIIIFIRSLILVLLANSFLFTLSVDKALFIASGAQLISIIPAPLNGYGVREGGILLLLNIFHISTNFSAPVAFSFRIVLLLGIILMFLLLLSKSTYAKK